jgi:hypothetical protein
MEEDKKSEAKLYVVGLRECAPCSELQNELKKEEIKEALKEKFGTDKYDVLYADEDGENGNKARNICYSLDKFSSPILVIEKKEKDKTKLCLINENLEEERCGLYKELPK